MSETYFKPLTDQSIEGLESFSPEQFVPRPGTLLIVMPPKVEQHGSIYIPQSAQEERCFARIAVVAEEDLGRFKPGQWVVFRNNSAEPISFGGRKDLYLLHFTDEADSDVFGILAGEPDLKAETEQGTLEQDRTNPVLVS